MDGIRFRLAGDATSRKVWLNNRELTPERSQKIRNHSPDGFAWGYGGSGPAQLALAVLIEVTGERPALDRYQAFKAQHIAALDMDSDFDREFEIPRGWA